MLLVSEFQKPPKNSGPPKAEKSAMIETPETVAVKDSFLSVLLSQPCAILPAAGTERDTS